MPYNLETAVNVRSILLAERVMEFHRVFQRYHEIELEVTPEEFAEFCREAIDRWETEAKDIAL